MKHSIITLAGGEQIDNIELQNRIKRFGDSILLSIKRIEPIIQD